jgi:hypothetical protein
MNEVTESLVEDEAVREAMKALRLPFAPEAYGVLPKPYRKDSPKGTCPECGGWHGLPAVHLNFVGHAAVTDRLLTVDYLWNWEPLAYDEDGLPFFDRTGGLWIKLTVKGVTRLGYGDGDSVKERIGDAIRNAAMRFGVALDLWTKDELESLIGNEKVASRKRKAPGTAKAAQQADETPARARRSTARDPATAGLEGMSAQHRNKLIGHLAHLDPPIRGGDAQVAYISRVLELTEPIESLAKLTKEQGEALFRLFEIEA